MSTDQVVEGGPTSSELLPGTQIGRYVLGKKLGRGGFGVVFRAHDTSLDREVALKFLHAEHTATPQMLGRFLQEARSAAKIAHAGIVTVYECGQISGTNSPADGSAYIAMELLQGESLTDRLARSGRLDPPAAMEITRQVASALEAAHRAGIVHRDLKPDNIFLIPDSAVQSGERVKVLDFGIAKLGRAASGVETQSMMVFGTPRYMSPEQCRSAASVDHRSDIYTLGCILFELVTGKPPFAGAAGELIAQHVLVEAPRAELDEAPALDELIAELLAKEPGDRPQTMAAVIRALERAGAWSPGVAPTLLPDAIASAKIMLPVSLQPPSGRVRAIGTSNPTTLHAATGVSVVQPAPIRPGRRLAIAAGALATVVVVLAVTLIVRARGAGSDASGDAVPGVFVDRPTKAPPPAPVEKPKPAPRPEPPKVAPGAPAKTKPAPIGKARPPATTRVAPKPEQKPGPKPEPKPDPKPEPKTDQVDPKTEPATEPETEPKVAPKPEPKPGPKRDKTINPFAKRSR